MKGETEKGRKVGEREKGIRRHQGDLCIEGEEKKLRGVRIS